MRKRKNISPKEISNSTNCNSNISNINVNSKISIDKNLHISINNTNAINNNIQNNYRNISNINCYTQKNLKCKFFITFFIKKYTNLVFTVLNCILISIVIFLILNYQSLDRSE